MVYRDVFVKVIIIGLVDPTGDCMCADQIAMSSDLADLFRFSVNMNLSPGFEIKQHLPLMSELTKKKVIYLNK